MRELAVMVPFRESHKKQLKTAAGADLRVTFLPDNLPADEQSRGTAECGNRNRRTGTYRNQCIRDFTFRANDLGRNRQIHKMRQTVPCACTACQYAWCIWRDHV